MTGDAKVRLLARLRETVQPENGQVPAFVIASPDVYDLEMERIFQRVWLFVAHESEIPAPEDFVTRQLGPLPVIVSRGKDGGLRVLLNMCRHRGMRVVRSDQGSASHYRCPYHGFTYACDGRLTGIPYQKDAYADVLDRSAMGLMQARVESYKGLIFATWNPQPEPLAEYLGDMKWYLDILVGRAEMEVIGPPQRWVVPAAWKLPAENFASDAFHTATTHASIAELYKTNPDFGKIGFHVDAGNGHGLGIGTQQEGKPYPRELETEIAQHLSADQQAVFGQVRNFHGNVFPNLSFLIPTLPPFEGQMVTSTTIRLWQPLAPDKIEIYSWWLVEKNAPAWWKDLGRTSYIQTFGTSGMFEQDDTENWEAQTRNATALLGLSGEFTLNLQMGSHRQPIADFPGPGAVYDIKYMEANSRAFYSRWLNLLLTE